MVTSWLVRLGKSLSNQPYLLLTLTSLFWAGNAVAGRLAVDAVSPMLLVFLRWLLVCLILLIAVKFRTAIFWSHFRQHWIFLLAMGGIGFSLFSGLFYLAATKTTAINIGVIQGSIPLMVIFGAFVAYRTHVAFLQIVAVLVTMLGVLVVVARGELAVLITAAINFGDVLMVITSILYSCYTLGLQRKPKMAAMLFFAGLAFAAFCSSIPLLVIEISNQATYIHGWRGWLVVAYVVIFPSLGSQIFYIRGVELIGPVRAGIFINFIPIFTALLAIIILRERFQFYHLIALALVFLGVAVNEYVGKRKHSAKLV